MPRDNRYMYIVHVCLYLCYSGSLGSVCCVKTVVKNSVFKSWSVELCCIFV